MIFNRELMQLFVQKRFVKKAYFETIVSEADSLGLSVTEHLLAKKMVTEMQALTVLSLFYGLPCIDLEMLDPDRELVDRFSFAFLKKYKVVPVRLGEDGTLLAAVSDPCNFYGRSALALNFPGKIECILVPAAQIDKYVESLAAVKSTSTALQDLAKEKDTKNVNALMPDDVAEDEVINAPSVRLVDSIIREAIPFRASDIHIEPYEKTVRVRYRIDGTLQQRAEFPIESFPAVCARLKILAGINIAERRIPQDGRITMNINDTDYDFRVSTLPTVFGEKFVIRILDRAAFAFTRELLNFTPEENVFVDRMLAQPHGIILMTGPTGCGKSTTLYSFLEEINQPGVNIVTVEDPVEYTMPGINQTQVNIKANLTFASALRSILRQDPNVIMIGEIRDEETAQIAIRAAITGHLVFSTLHTNDAPGSVTRLTDMGVEPYLLGDALVGVISQRLVKRLCPACRRRSKATPREMEILKLTEPTHIYRPVGCPFCNNTGYRGRIAVHEVMYAGEELRAAINHRESLETIRTLAAQGGMTTLWESCRDYVLKGITSLPELMQLAVD